MAPGLMAPKIHTVTCGWARICISPRDLPLWPSTLFFRPRGALAKSFDFLPWRGYFGLSACILEEGDHNLVTKDLLRLTRWPQYNRSTMKSQVRHPRDPHSLGRRERAAFSHEALELSSVNASYPCSESFDNSGCKVTADTT